jgi:Tfp pilus assembly protein PilO
MSLNGSFDDILIFISELYRVDRLIRVADFQISGASRQGNADSLDARLRVIVLAEND